jgi:beta-glucosidase
MEGKASSVMCAYNAVDGVPACASEALLDRRAKENQSGFGRSALREVT